MKSIKKQLVLVHEVAEADVFKKTLLSRLNNFNVHEIHFHDVPTNDVDWKATLSKCDAVLLLHKSSHVELLPQQIRKLYEHMPIIVASEVWSLGNFLDKKIPAQGFIEQSKGVDAVLHLIESTVGGVVLKPADEVLSQSNLIEFSQPIAFGGAASVVMPANPSTGTFKPVNETAHSSVGSISFASDAAVAADAPMAEINLSLEPVLETTVEPPLDPIAIQSDSPVDAPISSESSIAVSDSPVIVLSTDSGDSAQPVALSESIKEQTESGFDLPYLNAQHDRSEPQNIIIENKQSESMTDSVTPSPLAAPTFNTDVDTLKKYLNMREQDAAVLSAQLGYAKQEIEKLEDTIKRKTYENEDLYHQLTSLKEKVQQQEQEISHLSRRNDDQLDEVHKTLKIKNDRVRFLEERLASAQDQYEKLKDRVRLDIRKIRVRERELESKLEILKRDSETLISARESKILELKRKIDLLEFNFDVLIDKNEQERNNTHEAQAKLEKLNLILKQALGSFDQAILSKQVAGAQTSGGDLSTSVSGASESVVIPTAGEKTRGNLSVEREHPFDLDMMPDKKQVS